MVAVFCFASYSLAGNILTTAEAYTALALFNLLRFPLAFLPFLITMIVNAMVSGALPWVGRWRCWGPPSSHGELLLMESEGHGCGMGDAVKGAAGRRLAAPHDPQP